VCFRCESFCSHVWNPDLHRPETTLPHSPAILADSVLDRHATHVTCNGGGCRMLRGPDGQAMAAVLLSDVSLFQLISAPGATPISYSDATGPYVDGYAPPVPA
jgi:hypothetical protein